MGARTCRPPVEPLASGGGDRRADALVATKIWTDSLQEGRRQLDAQLSFFGGRVDLEQVHNLVAWREHLDWLEEERDAGRDPVARRDPPPAGLDLGVIAMRPLGGGSLVGRAGAAELLKWTLADERVHVAIPATSRVPHGRVNAAAGAPPWPSAAQREALLDPAAR